MTAVPNSADIASQSGAADMAASIKRALAEDLRSSRWSRAEVAEKLSRLAGRPITEHHIDAFAADSKAGYRFPAELVGAWVQVLGSRRLLDLICGELGYHAADDTERGLAELGRAQIQREKLDRQLEKLKGDLWTRA